MAMKKFINDAADLTPELLDGYVAAYGNKVALQSEKLVVRASPKDESKVAIVTLGGAGHEPALSGFVGEGMLDISVVGDIFAAPGPPKVFEALKAANREAGVLFVVLNHAGDVMSANIAMEMAEKEGLNVKMILTHEDIAPGADAPIEDRRGLAVGSLRAGGQEDNPQEEEIGDEEGSRRRAKGMDQVLRRPSLFAWAK